MGIKVTDEHGNVEYIRNPFRRQKNKGIKRLSLIDLQYIKTPSFFGKQWEVGDRIFQFLLEEHDENGKIIVLNLQSVEYHEIPRLVNELKVKDDSLTSDEKIGVGIVSRSLEEPMRWIAQNAGHEGASHAQRPSPDPVGQELTGVLVRGVSDARGCNKQHGQSQGTQTQAAAAVHPRCRSGPVSPHYCNT